MKSIEVDQCVGRKVGGRDNGRGYGERGVKVKRCADLGLGAKSWGASMLHYGFARPQIRRI